MKDKANWSQGALERLDEADLARVRQAVQDQVIECLNKFYALETGMWGGPLHALILRTIIQGHLQDKLYDISALALALELPIATVHRKINELAEAGLVEKKLRGKSVLLLPTAQAKQTLDRSFDDMICVLQRLYGRLDSCDATRA